MKLSAQQFSMIRGCPRTHRIFMMWLATHMRTNYLPPTCNSPPNRRSNAATMLAQANISSASLLVNVAALKRSAHRQRVCAGRSFHAIVPPVAGFDTEGRERWVLLASFAAQAMRQRAMEKRRRHLVQRAQGLHLYFEHDFNFFVAFFFRRHRHHG